MKEILIIITGSVSAFKSLELIRMLKKEGHNINVILSKGGEDFVTPLSASALSGNDVLIEDSYNMEHISLSRKCDLILICPASASFINKLAYGFGGELALDLMLAKKQETQAMICPAMNVEMWNNEVLQNNLTELEKQDFTIINPQKGRLLCEEEGEGKLASLDFIFGEVKDFFSYQNSLKGLKFVITSGGTVEKIDNARFISNFSSGLQGALIAKELANRGAEVFVIEAKASHDIRLVNKNIKLIKVLSAKEMLDEVKQVLLNNKIEGFFAVAAVADFAVKNYFNGKIKKDKMPTLELEYNPDILSYVGNLKENRPNKVIGFAAEEENLIENGLGKLNKKNCDFIFANHMCFESLNTTGYLISSSKQESFKGSKKELASFLLEKVC